MYAEGGFVDEEEASGYEKLPEEGHEHGPHEENELLDKVMISRSKGDVVAQDVGEGQEVDKEPNQFDVAVADPFEDDFHYDGENSGDMEGNEAMDERDDDTIDEVMKSRRKKDRLPSPR